MSSALSRRALFAAPLFMPVAASAAAPAALPAADLLDLMAKPGSLSFMRHALAPFNSAPRETSLDADDLGPCQTQRNLNDQGRADARRIGGLLRARGLFFEQIWTSKWCRCRETAELIAGRPVPNLPLIDSYWTSPRREVKRPMQLAALRAFMANTIRLPERALMVSHGSLIGDLTGIETAETEVVVLRIDRVGLTEFAGRGTL